MQCPINQRCCYNWTTPAVPVSLHRCYSFHSFITMAFRPLLSPAPGMTIVNEAVCCEGCRHHYDRAFHRPSCPRSLIFHICQMSGALQKDRLVSEEAIKLYEVSGKNCIYSLFAFLFPLFFTVSSFVQSVPQFFTFA